LVEPGCAGHEQRQIRNNQSIDTFMKSKFTSQQLYRWMVGKLSAVYFQTYQLALDYAKGAQRAMQFEMGWPESDAQLIGAYYWENLQKGLLAGERLQLDLDRLEKTYLEKNQRRFEITKTVSLMISDPLALVSLQQKGSCEFELSEAMFDHDFPGHFCRQIKAISVSFPAVVGPYENFNATLTQLGNRTVMRPDLEAVKYLVTGDGTTPASIRSDWRPTQQVALSRGVNDSGLFQLNYQDERFLPFEGTGAVSRWRLQINGVDGELHRREREERRAGGDLPGQAGVLDRFESSLLLRCACRTARWCWFVQSRGAPRRST
jgi:Tc toxin complex TcA C-terminal TcB-binding domain